MSEAGVKAEQVVIQHRGNSMVFVMPATTPEHNIIIQLLQRLRLEYPGAWFCVQQWERDRMPQLIGQADINIPDGIPIKTENVVGKMKAVSRNEWGLPKDEPLGDVPA
jgi:hypothetical protein